MIKEQQPIGAIKVFYRLNNKAKLDRIREAVESMTGLPSVSKLAAFLETIREIIKPKEG